VDGSGYEVAEKALAVIDEMLPQAEEAEKA
jgi:hypothetical protein